MDSQVSCLRCKTELTKTTPQRAAAIPVCATCLNKFPGLRRYLLAQGSLTETLNLSASVIFWSNFRFGTTCCACPLAIFGLVCGGMESGFVIGLGVAFTLFFIGAVTTAGIVAIGTSVWLSVKPVISVADGRFHLRTGSFDEHSWPIEQGRWREGSCRNSRVQGSLLLPKIPCLLVDFNEPWWHHQFILPVGISLESRAAWMEFFDLAEIARKA